MVSLWQHPQLPFGSSEPGGGGEIMAVSHATRPVFGVQFHPESIGSQFGKVMLANFLKRAGVK